MPNLRFFFPSVLTSLLLFVAFSSSVTFAFSFVPTPAFSRRCPLSSLSLSVSPQSPPRPQTVLSSSLSSSPSSTISIPLGTDGNTRCLIPFDLSTASRLGSSVNSLLQAFKLIKENADGGARVKQEVLLFGAVIDGVSIELECNPNIFPGECSFRVSIFAYYII